MRDKNERTEKKNSIIWNAKYLRPIFFSDVALLLFYDDDLTLLFYLKALIEWILCVRNWQKKKKILSSVAIKNERKAKKIKWNI